MLKTSREQTPYNLTTKCGLTHNYSLYSGEKKKKKEKLTTMMLIAVAEHVLETVS